MKIISQRCFYRTSRRVWKKSSFDMFMDLGIFEIKPRR